MDIKVKIIPHKDQRYETCGDWYEESGTFIITVSDTKKLEYNALIAIHEIIEAMLCKNAGISERVVTNFDKDFEQIRVLNQLNSDKIDTSEPGDDPKAPYRKQHLIATGIEKILAAEMSIDWQEYEKTVNNL